MIHRIGEHMVAHESIESPVLDEMLGGERVHVFYSDPPWGDGNLKYWATINRRMTGREFAPLSYSSLVARIVSLIASHVDGHVFVETGPKWERETKDALSSVLHSVVTYPLKYRSGGDLLPNVLLYGVTGEQHATMKFDPSGMHGYEVPKRCVAAVKTPGGVVLDPCCGMGYSAKAAVAAGMRFRGNEFNEQRLQKTIAFLRKSSQ